MEFAIGPRLVGTAALEIAHGAESADFAMPLTVEARAAVTVRLMPDNIELAGSPIIVAPAPEPSFPAAMRDAEFVEVKRPALDRDTEVALFVTHSRTGALKPHVAPYLQALKAENIATILIVAADNAVSLHADALALAAGAIVRRNSGYDFGAWAHALRIYPEAYGASSLYLINDSMFGPPGGEAFPSMIDRIRHSDADLIGLTENLEYRWHLQSFFLVLRPKLLASGALHAFFDGIRPFGDKDDVIKAYELHFAPMMQVAGFRAEAIFANAVAGNATLKRWRPLIEQGFPFVKVSLISGAFPDIDTSEWRNVLDAAGFDLTIVDAALQAAREVVPLEHSDRLLAHPLPAPPDTVAQARISYFGSWDTPDIAGQKARVLIAALRELGDRLSLHFVGPAPTPVVGGFSELADLAVIDLEAVVAGDRYLDGERLAITARRRVGLLDAVIPHIIRGGFCDEIWTTNRDVAEAALRFGGTPAVLMPELDPTGSAATPVATDFAPGDLRRRVAELLESPPGRLEQPDVALDLGIPVARADFGSLVHWWALDADGRPSSQTDPADALWIGLAPADALLAPLLASILADHALRRPDVALFYGDDLAIETEFPADRLRLKPDFDLTLLGSQDYVGAPVFVRRDAWDRLGGIDARFATGAVAELLFRAHGAGLAIGRIPEVLLAHPGARRKALDEDFRRVLDAQPRPASQQIVPGRVPGSWLRRAHFPPADAPAVTLIIPTARAGDGVTGRPLIEHLLESIAVTDWPMDRLTILVGDDHADEPDWARARWPFQLHHIAMPRGTASFNFSAKMNALWKEASTEQLVLLNDDIRASDPHWLSALQAHAVDPTVGAVGARLLYPDGRLQHAGMAPSADSAMHLWVGRRALRGTSQDWALVAREWSMVTGAVLATRRSLLAEIGGFDESLPLEYNDTDLCLRLRTSGYRIVYQPGAELVHHERASRGATIPPGDSLARFRRRWRAWLDQDPSWHPRLRRDRFELQPALDPAAWYARRIAPARSAH